MPHKNLTYLEALELINKKLNKEKSIKEFCKKHKLVYGRIINLRTQPETPRLKELSKLLMIYGYTVHAVKKITFFEISLHTPTEKPLVKRKMSSK